MSEKTKPDKGEKKKKEAPGKFTGDPIIDKIINNLHSTLGKTLVTLGPSIRTVPPISTGSLGLDLALGIGGFPQGRIVEILGLESSGKTSLGLVGARNAQQMFPDDYILIADMEYTQTGEQWESFGLDPSRILLAQADTVGEIFQVVMDLVKTGRFRYLLFDSIDACQTEAMLNKDIAANDVGGISKIASRFFREFSKVCVKTNCTGVFVNQIKMSPTPFGDPRTTPGGSALRFYASQRIEASPIKPSKTMANAFLAQYKIKKNKCAPAPIEPIQFDFIYNYGPDPVIDTLNAAKDLGVLAFAGPSLKMNFPDKEPEIIAKGGVAGWIELCEEHPEIMKQVHDACYATRKNVLPLDVVAALDADEPVPADVVAELGEQL
jgi:recombination protein RecA